MEKPDFWDNQEKAQEIIQQLKPLNALINPWRELESSVEDVQVMTELAEEEESMEAELDSELGKVEKTLDGFELRAMFDGPADINDAYVKVNAGSGGTEACDWAAMLMRMYIRWCERNNFKVDVIDQLDNEEAGIRNVTLHIHGDYAYGNLQSETGVHRLVRISPFDANSRRHTSFAAVDVTPDIEGTIEIDIKDDDLIRQTFRSGGPGGQHQNKTESGVRYIHEPTGIAAESRSERSQHKNDARALALLKSKMFKIEEEKKQAEVEKHYDEKGEVAWGSQIRNYVMQPYTLVKDVRTGTESGQVQNVLDGAIDDFIQSYLRMKTEKTQKSS